MSLASVVPLTFHDGTRLDTDEVQSFRGAESKVPLAVEDGEHTWCVLFSGVDVFSDIFL